MEPNLEDIALAVEEAVQAEKEQAQLHHPETSSIASGDSSAQTTPPLPMWKELMLAGKTGAGMFVESYWIFAVGNIGSIWKYLYPSCFHATPGDGCDDQTVVAVPYVEIAGIIAGMLIFGAMADHLGRLWGSRCTAGLMLLGGIMCVVSFGIDLTGQFIMFCISIFLFSLGVGGEYPMASSSASERSEAENLGRGRTVVLTFACQGWGNFINTAVICILLVITGTGGCSKNNLATYGQNDMCASSGLNIVWRVQYALLIPVIGWLVWLRLFKLKESKVWEKRQEHLNGMEAKDLRIKRLRDARMLYSKEYLPRLIGTAGTWFVWDVAFYGNKLFQGKIISVIVGDANSISLQDVLNATLLNSFVGLCGYYFAAFTIDRKWMGRVRMQNMGFLISFILFIACGYGYDQLILPKNIPLFQFLYYMSSFFAQWGANATTWLLPVELFPTDIRSQAHGVSAASGKLGALAATLAFSFGNNGSPVTAQQIFQISGYCCLAGLILTLIFVPDVTGVPLWHMDKEWNDIMKVKYNQSPPPSARNEASGDQRQAPADIEAQSQAPPVAATNQQVATV